MKKTVLKSIFLLFTLATPIITTGQEGGLKSLKDKISNIGNKEGKEGAEGKPAKMTAEDRDRAAEKENTVLEGITIKPDDFNINGIYYSTATLKAKNDSYTQEKNLTKFLVEYKYDTEKKLITLSLNNIYSYEKTNRNNLVKPIMFYRDINPSHVHKAFQVNKQVFLWEGNARDWKAPTRTYTKDLQNEYSPSKMEYQPLDNDIYQVEPGIIIVGQGKGYRPYEVPKEMYEQNSPLVVLYKPEKEEEAKKYTGAEGYKKIKEIYDNFHTALDNSTKGSVELAKPVAAFKEEPTNAVLVEAVKKRMAEMPYYKNKQLVYVYSVAPWEQFFENVGLLGRTLVYRQMQVVAVFKDGSKCQNARMLLRQDNTYVGGTSQEKWTGNPVFCNGDQQLEDMDCTKAMKYKK